MLVDMRRPSSLLAALLLCVTLACGAFEPTPPPNRDFVGVWMAKDGTATLAVSPEGHVNYARKQGSTNTTIDAPAKAWTDSSFTVGAMGISTDFTIDHAPKLIDGVWHMTVDGLEYTRAGT
jgi:predicted naringenin-chalcone synthase